MRTLQRGSRGPEVYFAQRLFNEASIAWNDVQPLADDGVFGPRTEAAIIAFQRRYTPTAGVAPLRPYGIIDDPTWRALGARIAFEHGTRLIPQTNANNCWEACMNMVLGGTLCREIPATMLNPSGPNAGRLRDDLATLRSFAALMGRRLENAPSSALGLKPLMQAGPAILLGRSTMFRDGHAVVLSAFWSDAAATDSGSVVRLLNPSPIGHGAITPSLYPYMEIERRAFTPEYLIVR